MMLSHTALVLMLIAYAGAENCPKFQSDAGIPTCGGLAPTSSAEVAVRCHGSEVSPFIRYGEFLEITYSLPKSISVKVWNTIGCNAAPEDQWKHVAWSNTLVSNGPRYWQMDSIVQQAPQANAVDPNGFYLLGAWNGIGSKLVGNVEYKLNSWKTIKQVMQMITGNSAYVLTYVARETVWRYRPGRQIHQLVDSEGNVYTMQSSEVSSVESIMGLTYAPAVPTGWTYRCRVLGSSGLDVAANNETGIATILKDEFGTAYMLTEVPQCNSLYADESCKKEDWSSITNECKDAAVRPTALV